MSWLALSVYGQTKDISGTWIAKRESPMGEMEMVCELKVVNGKITGTQKLPFGDTPIIDGKVEGDTFEFTVETESFGTLSKRTVIGKIVGDTLQFAPTMPQRPPGGGLGGVPGGGGPPPGMVPGGGANRPPGAPPQGGGPGGPGGPGGMFPNEPLTWRRGTPTPSYRAASVNYRELPKVELPALKEVPRNNLAKTPPMGWNSWNKFRTNISDKIVREIADAMVASGMRDAGYIYLNIDDGWQWKRDEKGVLLPNPNFPDMKKLADYVHSKGLLLGIYSSPGPTTCGGYTGSYGHEEIDAKTWAKWGIDYLKYDWCSASRIWKDEDMPAVYQRMGEALRQAGRPMVYSLCQYGRANVGEWGPKVGGNLWRTTFDIRDQWESMEGIGFSQNDWAKFAAPGHWNDPDMLEVGNGRMTTEEYRTHFSLWALLAAPLIAGNDLRSMTKEVKEILLNEEVIAVNQDKLGKAATRLSQQGETEVWAKPLNKGAYAVGFFNRGAKEATVGVKWTAFNMRGKLKVRDLWKHASLGEWTDNFSIAVPSHGVVLLRVTR
jgi:alpha-galactosidase